MNHKSMLSKILAVLLALTMMAPMAVNAATFTDTATHWAADSIEYMVSKKVLDGMGDGTFQPDAKVTRAQFIKMIDETFGLVATKALSFADVKSTDWYYSYVSKAYAQGYLLDYGSRLNPNGELSREEAVALVARYLELPSDEAVSKSTFSDYSQIDSDYREYVLSAVYAGIIVGRTSTTFDPKATLTRAEALAILCRAAGTIYDATATGLDAKAEKGNAVVKSRNVTVKSADVKGDVIVTEGVNSGTTTLYKLDVGGTVYLRGASKLVLSECDIEELVVDTGLNTAVSITIEDSTKIGDVKFISPATVELKDGTSVSELTVGEKATGSSVTGKGSIGTAYINSARFRSEMMPQKYEIGDGLTATLAGTSMSGSASDYTGFTKAPTTEVKEGYDYLTFTAYKNGYVYYYYANSAAAPTADEFKSTYNSNTSNMKGKLATTANTSDTEKAKAAASAASYSHIVLCFEDSNKQYYKPVVIKRAAANDGYGFSGDPTITVTTTGYDTLTATPLYTGKLYYYYTTSPTAPTTNLFMTNYTSASVKNTLNVTANKATTQNLSYSGTVSSYNYVVIMLVDSSNKSYQPKVLARSANNNISAIASGFNTAPSVSEINGYDYFSYNAIATGTMYYYYSASSAAPTASNFLTYYNKITDATLKGTFTVSQASASLSQRHHSTLTMQSLYPYVVFMLQSANGSYTPYVATRGATANATASGFSSTPTVMNMGNSDMITVVPSYSGTLRFYYTNSSTAPTAAEFNTYYSSYATNSAVPSSIATATAGQTIQAPFDLSQYGAASTAFSYVVFMLQSNTTSYQPVVVQRSSNITNSQNSGFVTPPTITSTSSTTNDQLTMYTNGAGTVYYYYTQNYGQIATSSTMFSTYFSYNSTYSGTIPVNGYTTASTAMPTSISGSYYVVMMFVPAGILGVTNSYTPTFVYRQNTTGTGSGSTAPTSSGFASNGTPKVVVEQNQDRLQFTSSIKGTLYYYYSNTTTDNSLTFMEEYAKATTKDTTKVSSGVQRDYSVSAESKTYIVIMLIDESNQMYKPTHIKRTPSSN